MSSVRWSSGDSNVYLNVNSHWFRYDTSLPPVGEGAMGLVYVGFDCVTNRKVAVKVLRQEFWADQQIRKRLKLEASLQFVHPHLVHMIGFCEDDPQNGPLFVLSEYVTGVTFRDHVDQLIGWSDKERNKKIVREFLPLFDAIGFLHANGIVHRDIKPANIMFQDGCHLKLMDLGVSKANHFFDAHLKGFIGTKPFAAPEQQVDDDIEADIDERTDIYAAGVTLSYLLVDHYPLRKNDDVSFRLRRIISKSTAGDPDQRYQSADAMRFALEDYLERKVPLEKYIPQLICGVLIFALMAFLITYLLTRY